MGGSTPLDCESKCRATSDCVGIVFADESCSGQSGPICWTKGAIGDPTPHSCRNSRQMKYAYAEGVDYAGNDIAPCQGCVLPTGSSHLDCEKKCDETPDCVGYVFADESCSGQSGPICRPKGSMG